MNNETSVSSNSSEESDIKNVISGGTMLETGTSTQARIPPSPSKTEIISTFGDYECGEPFQPQHFVIDFTPDEAIDTEENQKKCLAFFEFFKSQPELEAMFDMPDTDANAKIAEWTKETDPDAPLPHHPLEKSALSMLSLANHAGIIDPAFEPEICESHCTMGDREYKENEPGSSAAKPAKGSGKKRGEKVKEPCKCTGSSCTVCNRNSTPLSLPSVSQPEVQSMCKNLTEWDNRHPKSMEPPGHPPGLSNAIMQRLPRL